MDSLNPPSPFHARRFSRSSSLSEFDIPSDSDWLDVSSSRESDDNDSVFSDSDRDRVDHIPTSRGSSASVGSSRDGDIEAWEGFVDDSADEALPVDQIISQQSEIPSPAPDDASPAVEEDDDEEQRVKDALDQSMISTLSASRSSSLGASAIRSTAHSSLRDLKLSFPDPLTSSRDEIDTSSGNVSPSETTFSATDGDELVDRADTLASHNSDPGPLITPEIPQVDATSHVRATSYLDIVLYGSSPAFKWTFVDNLVKKAAIGAGGRAVILTHKITSTYTRRLRIQEQGQHEEVSSLIVSVTDRTVFSPGRLNDVRFLSHFHMILTTTSSQSSAKFSSDRPSLAIIYFPSKLSLPSAAQHDHFLPVFARGSETFNYFNFKDARTEATRSWESLAIPAAKVLSLKESEQSCLLHSDELDELQPSDVQRAFERISAPDVKKSVIKRFARQLTPAHTMTLYVGKFLLCI
jgi:hypothetical protein